MTTKVGKLYRLLDGTQADPKDCSADADGVLRHKNGIAVAVDGNGDPETIGEQAAEGGAVKAAEPADSSAHSKASE